MPDIYTYYDYQKYLSDFYHEKKSQNAFFSYRYISQKVGIDHALLIKIFQGKRHLSSRSIQAFAALMGLSRRKAEYFEFLVLYGKAKTDRETKHYFEKLLAFSNIDSHKIESDKYEFYQKWYYSAVRELIRIYPIDTDFKTLAGLVEPSITPAEAKKAVGLLQRLGFIRKNRQGFFEQTDRFITTGDEWRSIAIRSFQKECMKLASQALETIPKVERDISTVTVTLDDEGFEKARERVQFLQKEIVDIAASCGNVNRVYQINLQVFPLSKKVEKIGDGDRT